MDESEIAERLFKKGVKVTSNRILVFRELIGATSPVTLSDLESRLLSMDKSSIFRVLTLFLEHDVVDSFEDGRGVINYELCRCSGRCNHRDAHIHFYCELCHRSFCLRDIPIAEMLLPEGFYPHSISFVIKGECPECRAKKH